MASGSEFEIGKFLWGLIVLPISWLYHRLNKAHIKIDETRITLAERHYTKLEVQDLVDRSTKPIHDKLDNMKRDLENKMDGIKDDLNYLTRRRRDDRDDQH